MATSGSTRVNVTSNGHIYLLFSWSTKSQSVANNNSVINWNLKLISVGNGANIIATQPKALNVIIDDKRVADRTVNVSINAGASRTLESGTVTVPHTADGTETFVYSFSQAFNINYAGVQIGTRNGKGQGTLNTIPRATTPTVPNSADFNSTITIQTPRASNTFTHTLKYKLGDASGTIGTGITTSKTWTIPAELMNQIPNATSASIAITCETLNGNISLGTKTVTLTANVPVEIKPTISNITLIEAVEGIAPKFNAFVQYQSRMRADISAVGVFGSTIKTYSSTFEGLTHKTATFTSGTINGSGTIPVTVTVTDSRGRTATLTSNISVLAYYAPKLATFKAVRCNSSGTPNDAGNHLKIDLSADICKLNNLNDKSYKVAYKQTNASSYGNIETGAVYELNKSIVTGAIAGSDNTYKVQLTLSDYFTASVFEIDIPTTYSLIDFNASGKGIAFGEASSSQDFSVAMVAHFKKGVIIDDTSLIPGLKETDWQFLTLENTFKPYTDNQINTPRWRRRGKVVDIRGVFSPVANMASNYTQVKFAGLLPEEIRPSETIYQLCVGSTKETWTLSIKNDGSLNISQYGISAYGTIQANARLIFQITYTLD